MLTVDRIDQDDRFAGMAAEWDALLRTSPARCIFLTWEWLHTWRRHLGQDRELRILAVRQDGDLVGVAPLVLERARPERLSPLPTFEFLGTGEVGSDYLDLIARPGFEGQVLDAVAVHVTRSRAALRLRRFDPRSALAAELTTRLADSGWSVTRAGAEICPFIRLAGHTWDSYLASLGPEHRSNTRRRLKKIETACAVRFERVVSEDQRREVLPALISLHNQRWEGRGGSEAFHNKALVAFHEELSRLALARGWLRLFALRLDGRVAAALYGFLYDGRFSFYQSGFDPREARLGLGLATMGLAIKSTIAEGAIEYDLLHGDEPYKFLWCREVRLLEHLELFPPTAAGRIAQHAAEAIRGVKRAARRVLPPPVVAAAVAARRFWRARDFGAAAAR
jgi:CelD/BcsL family acetyltransferase involved in cellulose biosynthesis